MVVVRLGCHGRDEHLGFGTQRQVLAPVMECFGRHSHEHLPLNRAEIAFSFLLKKSIPEMRQKCERFQAFLSVSPIYLGSYAHLLMVIVHLNGMMCKGKSKD
jgi:hypothetical protein